MKKLKDILYKVAVNKIYGDTDIVINNIQFDSRLVQKKDLFVAQKGVTVDGHLFIEKALILGASVVVCESIPVDKKEGVT